MVDDGRIKTLIVISIQNKIFYFLSNNYQIQINTYKFIDYGIDQKCHN